MGSQQQGKQRLSERLQGVGGTGQAGELNAEVLSPKPL